MDPMLEKLPPQSLDAEMAVLGAILNSPIAYDLCAPLLMPDSFYRPEHRRIFGIVAALHDASKPCDLVTFRAAAQAEGAWEEIGGDAYLVDLSEAYTTDALAPYYARIVASKARLREMIAFGAELVRKAYDYDADPEILVDDCERMLASLAPAESESGLVHDEVEALVKPLSKEQAGIMLPWHNIVTRSIGSLKPGRLYVVGGRPGSGKTAFCLNIVASAAFRQGAPVALFVFDHERAEIVERLFSAEYGIMLPEIINHDLSAESRRKHVMFARDMQRASLRIFCETGQRITELRSVVRRLHRNIPLRLVVVGNIARMHTRDMERHDLAIGENVTGLKNLARECGLPVIVQSQLRRESEDHGRPLLRDFYASGIIEHEADLAMAIWRNPNRVEGSEREDCREDYAEFRVLKCRGGRSPVAAKVQFQGEFVRFVDSVRPEEQAALEQWGGEPF